MKHKIVYIIGIIFVILCPLLIAVGTSADILNWATNDNDWIGFWAEYFGTIIGSLVTLLVLWWTIRDNSKGREREEKIAYYNHLIELQATFVTDIANYFATVKTAFSNPTDEYCSLCVQAANLVAKESIEISLLLQVRQEQFSVTQIMDNLKNVNVVINAVTNTFEQCIQNGFSDKTIINQIINDMDEYEKNTTAYLDSFAELVRDEFNKE